MITTILSSRKNLQEFIRFCTVGVGNTSVNYIIYAILLMGLHVHYLIAGVIGYMGGAVFGFIVNRKWTFKADISNYYLFIYLLINVFSMSVNALIQWFVVEKLHVMAELSQICGIAVTTFINYFLTKKFVFS